MCVSNCVFISTMRHFFKLMFFFLGKSSDYEIGRTENKKSFTLYKKYQSQYSVSIHSFNKITKVIIQVSVFDNQRIIYLTFLKCRKY